MCARKIDAIPQCRLADMIQVRAAWISIAAALDLFLLSHSPVSQVETRDETRARAGVCVFLVSASRTRGHL
jgi:hypothetical protein